MYIRIGAAGSTSIGEDCCVLSGSRAIVAGDSNTIMRRAKLETLCPKKAQNQLCWLSWGRKHGKLKTKNNFFLTLGLKKVGGVVRAVHLQ